jgi:hypothetical protein
VETIPCFPTCSGKKTGGIKASKIEPKNDGDKKPSSDVYDWFHQLPEVETWPFTSKSVFDRGR